MDRVTGVARETGDIGEREQLLEIRAAHLGHDPLGSQCVVGLGVGALVRQGVPRWLGGYLAGSIFRRDGVGNSGRRRRGGRSSFLLDDEALSAGSGAARDPVPFHRAPHDAVLDFDDDLARGTCHREACAHDLDRHEPGLDRPAAWSTGMHVETCPSFTQKGDKA